MIDYANIKKISNFSKITLYQEGADVSVIYEKRILELEEKLDKIYTSLINFISHGSIHWLGVELQEVTKQKKPAPVKEPACDCSDFVVDCGECLH